MWHVSSRSGVATLRTAIHLLLTYLLTYYTCRRALVLFVYTVQVVFKFSRVQGGEAGLLCEAEEEEERDQ